jgi:hypothetical protein
MAECEINGVKYSTGQLNARMQWNITRRISPIISEVLPALRQYTEAPIIVPSANGALPDDGQARADADERLITVLQPFMDALSKLTDEQSDYIIDTCLKVATRARPDNSGWTKLMTPDGQFLFADVDMRVMLELTVRTIMDNLSDFTAALPGLSRVPQGVSTTSS